MAIGLSNIDLSKLDPRKIDLSDIHLGALDLNKLDPRNLDIRKSATEAGYVAVGAGVLGFQSLQQRRRSAQARFTEQSSALRSKASEAGSYVVSQVSSPGALAKSVTGQARDAVTPAFDAVSSRVEPTLEQIKGIPSQVAGSIPDSVKSVPASISSTLSTGVEKVRGTINI